MEIIYILIAFTSFNLGRIFGLLFFSYYIDIRYSNFIEELIKFFNPKYETLKVRNERFVRLLFKDVDTSKLTVSNIDASVLIASKISIG
jgi:hypothetical protein